MLGKLNRLGWFNLLDRFGDNGYTFCQQHVLPIHAAILCVPYSSPSFMFARYTILPICLFFSIEKSFLDQFSKLQKKIENFDGFFTLVNVSLVNRNLC